MCSLRKMFVNLLLCVFVILGLMELVSGGIAENNYEIKSLSGEPNYRSVNLTWEVENEEIENQRNKKIKENNFIVYYCEIQTWGPNRCKSKNLPQNNRIQDGDEVNSKKYSMMIDNLRMATKYSFHVRKQNKIGEQKSARDFNEEDLETNQIGESIIIPTKGFSAHATKCLPHASEIEVETGPYFAGKIASENGDCGINGDPKDPRETYTMQIDHEKCGSKVHHGNLTVETFITVQENLGIFTHSTRRFMVLCTYHPEMLTVRASFSVPGRGGATAVAPDFHQSGRNARERHFRLVDKSALVLKENDPESLDTGSFNIEELKQETTDDVERRARESRKIEDNYLDHNNLDKTKKNGYFAKLVGDRKLFDENRKYANSSGRSADQSSSTTGILIGVSVSIIMFGAFIYVIQREMKKQRDLRILDTIRSTQP